MSTGSDGATAARTLPAENRTTPRRKRRPDAEAKGEPAPHGCPDRERRPEPEHHPTDVCGPGAERLPDRRLGDASGAIVRDDDKCEERNHGDDEARPDDRLSLAHQDVRPSSDRVGFVPPAIATAQPTHGVATSNVSTWPVLGPSGMQAGPRQSVAIIKSVRLSAPPFAKDLRCDRVLSNSWQCGITRRCAGRREPSPRWPESDAEASPAQGG